MLVEVHRMPSLLDEPRSVLELEPKRIHRLTSDMNGMSMTVDDFRAATDEEPGYRFELLHGVLIVSPAPAAGERDPNGELEYLLRHYQRTHPAGSALNLTLFEQEIETASGIRRADRVIWAGLDRQPVPSTDVPTIVVEFVSNSSRDRRRDYDEKRSEYAAIGVRQYWIIDRFRRTMTVCSGPDSVAVIGENDVFETPCLPGFRLPLASLLSLGDRWGGRE
jgi:Uma2 family endonuclease